MLRAGGINRTRGTHTLLVADKEGILRHIGGSTSAAAASIRQLLTVPPPAISLGNSSLNFGTSIPAGESRTLSLVVQNTGGKELSITDIQSDLSGVTFSQTALKVAADGSATIEITFTPEGGGPFSGTITIFSDDPENGIVTVSFSGTAAIIKPPTISIANTSLDFGEDIKAGESQTRTLVVKNTGGKDLSITNLESDLEGVTFSLTELMVAPGDSATVDITFTPAEGGPFSGAITISSNDPQNRSAIVTFSGTAVVIRPPTISVSSTALDFGEDVPLDESRTLTLVVKNTGDKDLHIAGMESDLDGVTFNMTEITVATRDSAVVDVTFTPTERGPFSGTITILSNDPENERITVSISGTVIAVDNVARADFDNDGEVGFGDFVVFARAFNTDNPTFDLNGNGLVDFPDFLEFARHFGKRVS